MHEPHRLPHGNEVTCPEGHFSEQLLVLLRLTCRGQGTHGVAEQVWGLYEGRLCCTAVDRNLQQTDMLV